MADLLTHVLVAYVLATLLSWRHEWITPPLITVAMVGAVLPDLSRVDLVVPATTVETVLAVPFSWEALHRVGGVAVLGAMAVIAVSPRRRRTVLVLLALGAGSHFVLDAFSLGTTGVTRPFLWPLTDRGFVLPGFYSSSDRWPALVSVTIAAVVWMATRRRTVTPRTSG